ncbi:hypothetical protein EYF80_049646 [Liparis tanakae]|uniref:Uncharacterized protein n=1 Tax=Liparis tanakae TaxID=230148 RepID=A0A4Z2FH06_9TELE|nr:hypothetical protein EYF80_049646 [Liparis tanakae]
MSENTKPVDSGESQCSFQRRQQCNMKGGNKQSRAASHSLSIREASSRATESRKPKTACGSASLERTRSSSVRARVRAGTARRKPSASPSKPDSPPGLELRAESRRTGTDWLLRHWTGLRLRVEEEQLLQTADLLRDRETSGSRMIRASGRQPVQQVAT